MNEIDRHNEIRADIHRVIANYPKATIYAVIGALEVVKQDLMDELQNLNNEEKP